MYIHVRSELRRWPFFLRIQEDQIAKNITILPFIHYFVLYLNSIVPHHNPEKINDKSKLIIIKYCNLITNYILVVIKCYILIHQTIKIKFYLQHVTLMPDYAHWNRD